MTLPESPPYDPLRHCTVLSAYRLVLVFGREGVFDHEHALRLCSYAGEACSMWGCALTACRVTRRCLDMVVSLSPLISLEHFADTLRSWTVNWMRQYDPFCDFDGWLNRYYAAPLSHGHVPAAVAQLLSMPDDTAPSDLAETCGLLSVYDMDCPHLACTHHMVLGTHRALAALNPRFGHLLAQALGDTASAMGCRLRTACVMSDHMHLLVQIDPAMSVQCCADRLRAESDRWMRQNVHFRRVPGWSVFYAAFTVSLPSLYHEEYAIEMHHRVHARGHNYPSEMIVLAQNLGLPLPYVQY